MVGVNPSRQVRKHADLDTTKPVIVTAALPYANGRVHIGHVVEYVQADIINRFFSLAGARSGYYCASDVHGTPIEVAALNAGMSPGELVERHHEHNRKTLEKYGVNFSSFTTTHSDENRKLSGWFWKTLLEKGFLYEKSIELSYCEQCKRFLPDRFVKGSCPRCDASDQYGDVCEKCGAAYSTTDLKSPYCVLCKSAPVRKDSEHTFFKLSAFKEQLASWLSSSKGLQVEVANQALSWVEGGLNDWCVTRDEPYYGFPVPGRSGKYLYVWFDAPIGYLASVASTLDSPDDAIMKWNSSKIVHVIGKDILYFHLLFWPAMLSGAGLKLPDDIVVHGHLLWNGEKLSKSRGTLIDAEEFLKSAPHELVRYYYAFHLGRSMSDLDFSVDSFLSSVNNDLIANIANYCYRVLSFVMTKLDGKVGVCGDKEFQERSLEKASRVVHSYSRYELSSAVRGILELGSMGNAFFQGNAPWKLFSENPERCREVVATSVNLVKILVILLKPVLPEYAAAVEKQLGAGVLTLKDINYSYENRSIVGASILLRPLESFEVSASDPFSSVDLRVAKVVSVENHPKADKLFILKVDLGGEHRQIVAGIRPWYSREELCDKNIVIVANLKPAVLRGVESQGMLLAATTSGGVSILSPSKSSPGDAVLVEGIFPVHGKVLSIEEFSSLGLRVHNGSPSYKSIPLKTKSEVLTTTAPEGSIIG